MQNPEPNTKKIAKLEPKKLIDKIENGEKVPIYLLLSEFQYIEAIWRCLLNLFLDWRSVFSLLVMLTLCCFAVCFVLCFCFRSLVIVQVAALYFSWYGWWSGVLLLIVCMVRFMVWCFVAYALACLFVFLFPNIFYMSVCLFLWFVFGLNDCLLDWSIIRLIDRAI